MEKKLKPFVKWAGGKTSLLGDIMPLVPDKFNNYYEPFIGGGAVFLSLKPRNAIINDLNSELINTYQTIRDNPLDLINDLHKHLNNKEYFYSIRSLDRKNNYKELDNIKKASRFIYLNKTCFSGLYRVNKKGFFNTSFANYKNPNWINEDLLISISEYLNNNNIEFMNNDFKTVLDRVSKDDFVYIDPPYVNYKDISSYTGYTKEGFTYNDQLELVNILENLSKKQAKFLLSNSYNEITLDLYKNFEIINVTSMQSMGSKGNSEAKKTKEILVKNY